MSTCSGERHSRKTVMSSAGKIKVGPYTCRVSNLINNHKHSAGGKIAVDWHTVTLVVLFICCQCVYSSLSLCACDVFDFRPCFGVLVMCFTSALGRDNCGASYKNLNIKIRLAIVIVGVLVGNRVHQLSAHGMLVPTSVRKHTETST